MKKRITENIPIKIPKIAELQLLITKHGIKISKIIKLNLLL